MAISPDFLKAISGYGLTTAEIIYRIPDHQRILQVYIWQDYDIAPKFPALTRFLAFWARELDGPIYRVNVAHSALITPREIQMRDGEFTLH